MKKITMLVAIGSLLISVNSLAKMQCGPFFLAADSKGLMLINGQEPETQTAVTFLGKQEDYRNIMMRWTLADKKSGNYYGLQYIKRDGKGWLNAEKLRMNMDDPRVMGTYDCVKVK